MAFFFLCIAIFVKFFQPQSIFPQMASFPFEKISIFVALISYFFSSQKSKTPFWANKVNVFFASFVFLQIISSCAFYFYEGVETFNFWLHISVIYYLVVNSAISTRRIKIIILMVILGVAYLSYYFLCNFVAAGYTPGKIAVAYGSYENANDLVLILVAVIPLLLIFVNTTRKVLLKYFFTGITIMFSFNIFFTSSRNGMLSLLIVGLLSMILSHKISRFIRIVIYGLLLTGVFTIGLTNILHRSDLSEGGRLYGDNSSENRIEQWKAGMRMLKARPLLGVGRMQFKNFAENYGGIRGLAPHNTLVQVFSETGMPGGVFFILFAFYPIFQAKKILSGFKEKNMPKLGDDIEVLLKFLLISVLGYWVCAFFGNRYDEVILYIVVALIVALLNIIKKNCMFEANSFNI